MILVIGATGTVGSEVVKQLNEAGAEFKIGVSSLTKAKKANAEGVKAAVLDYTDPQTFQYALAGIDKLFLLSPPGATHLEAGLIDAAKNAGVKHIVKLSVIGAEGEGFIFAREHRLAEKLIIHSGVPYTFLRPNGFMQNYITNFSQSIQQQSAFYLSQGESKFSMVDVRDIAAVAVKALTQPGHGNKAYTITGPEALNNTQVAEKISKVAGKKVSYVAISDDDMRNAMQQQGTPPTIVEGLVDLMHYYIAGKAEEVSPDVERVLGRKPISFDQFARDNAVAFK